MKSGEGELDCYRSHVQAAKGRKPKARLCGCLGSRTVGNEMNHTEVLSGLQSKQLKDDRDHDMDLLVRCGDGKEMMLRTSQPEKQAWVQALNSAKLVRSYSSRRPCCCGQGDADQRQDCGLWAEQPRRHERHAQHRLRLARLHGARGFQPLRTLRWARGRLVDRRDAVPHAVGRAAVPRANLLSKTANSRYDYEGGSREDVSDSAKDLISRLLVADPEYRYTVDELLSHLWITGEVWTPCRRRPRVC